jgi:hypothetical protein
MLEYGQYYLLLYMSHVLYLITYGCTKLYLMEYQMICNLGLLGYVLVVTIVALHMHTHGWPIFRSHIFIRILQPRDPAKLSTRMPNTHVQPLETPLFVLTSFVSTSLTSTKHFLYTRS